MGNKKGKALDLTGKKFGMLTVISIDSKSAKNVRWKCKCDCGKEVSLIACNITNKNNKSCGCLRLSKRKEIGPLSQYFKGYGEICRQYFTRLKDNSFRRKIEFNLTIEYLWNLFLLQNRKCCLSGEYLIPPYSSNYKLYYNSSLDRIDSTKGYVEGNVQWVTKDINLMKLRLSNETFIEICTQISNYVSNK